MREEAAHLHLRTLQALRQMPESNGAGALPERSAWGCAGYIRHRGYGQHGKLGSTEGRLTMETLIDFGEPKQNEFEYPLPLTERYQRMSSEGWCIQWESTPPEQKSEFCSLDSREGRRLNPGSLSTKPSLGW